MKPCKTTNMIYLAAIFALVRCQEEIDQASAADLLISKPWKLVPHGLDTNKSNVLEENENLIEDCQKDNTYLFYLNGTGQYADNDLSCGTESSAEFSWKLLDSNTSLLIAHEHFLIIKLSEHELVLKHELLTVIDTYLHYTH